MGKKSLVIALNGNEFPEGYVPTIFENYRQEVEFEDNKYTLIWNTGMGTDDYDNLRPEFYGQSDVIFLCFSLVCKQSFTDLTERWIGEIRHFSKSAIVILLGTKSDERDDSNAAHVTDKQAKAFASKHKCAAFIACSPKNGDGMDQIFPALLSSRKKCLLL